MLPLRNLEIGVQFEDSENAQRNLEIGVQFEDSENAQRNLEIGVQFEDSQNAQCNLKIGVQFRIPIMHSAISRLRKFLNFMQPILQSNAKVPVAQLGRASHWS